MVKVVDELPKYPVALIPPSPQVYFEGLIVSLLIGSQAEKPLDSKGAIIPRSPHATVQTLKGVPNAQEVGSGAPWNPLVSEHLVGSVRNGVWERVPRKTRQAYR